MKSPHKKNSAARRTAAPHRKAAEVAPEIKSANLHRLRRIEGQIRGLQKMVQEDRYCADILVQISSVQEALRGVSRELMRNHLRHCVTQAVQKGPRQRAAGMYEEIVQLMYAQVSEQDVALYLYEIWGSNQCHFCGREASEINRLIEKNGARICDSCIADCYQLLRDDDENERKMAPTGS